MQSRQQDVMTPLRDVINRTVGETGGSRFGQPESSMPHHAPPETGKPPWRVFMEVLKVRFRPSAYLDYNIELSKIKQKGKVMEHQAEFEEVSNMVSGWPVEALIGTFVGGLNEEYRIKVQAAKPQSLLETFELARIAEEKSNRLRNG
ncbi:hypothetical protein EJ110_NYTH37225 [Nymphaea thermarum]|nr:hypothetical protein EJ110_NYTH37225 [Nymphaea thermarum]